KTGEGLNDLRAAIKGITSVLIGQSGTGKSSLINALAPDLKIREGSINEKFNRGIHTTTMSYMIELSPDTHIIDTPGVRLFIPDGIKAKELISHMREFSPLEGKCSYGISCSHKVEPGCKVMEAVYAGIIHEDRYDSFLSIYEALESKSNDY
ncbi:MAG: ribosome small subunit-dependent GTPase A, partial [Treponema sp.]|nr:ribosome small subunit-dependent GTPase A [Treponema sp.]